MALKRINKELTDLGRYVIENPSPYLVVARFHSTSEGLSRPSYSSLGGAVCESEGRERGLLVIAMPALRCLSQLRSCITALGDLHLRAYTDYLHIFARC